MADVTGLSSATVEKILSAKVLTTEHLAELAHAYGRELVDYVFADLVGGKAPTGLDRIEATLRRLAELPAIGARHVAGQDVAERVSLDEALRSKSLAEHLRQFAGRIVRFDASDAAAWAAQQPTAMSTVLVRSDGWRFAYIGSGVRLYSAEQRRHNRGRRVLDVVKEPGFWPPLFDGLPADGTPVAHRLWLKAHDGRPISSLRIATRQATRLCDMIVVTCEAEPG